VWLAMGLQSAEKATIVVEVDASSAEVLSDTP
jgi:hypothetical protein